MLQFLRRTLLRRLLAAWVLATFLPVVSATVACQIHCADEVLRPVAASTAADGDATHGHGAVLAAGPDGGDRSLTLSHALSRYLTHGGPCHLSVVPVMAESRTADPVRTLDGAWPPSAPSGYASFVPPPPEHRPRT